MPRAELLEPEYATVAEEVLFEVVDDRRVELPPMGARNARIAFKLASKVELFAEPRGLGIAVTEAMFRLGIEPNLQRRPDAAFVSTDRWALGREVPTGNAWDVVPDLVVEVISPTNLAEEVPTRVREFFAAGVRRDWVIYPHESLVYVDDSPRSIRVLGIGDALEGGAVIPDCRLALTDLF